MAWDRPEITNAATTLGAVLRELRITTGPGLIPSSDGAEPGILLKRRPNWRLTKSGPMRTLGGGIYSIMIETD